MAQQVETLAKQAWCPESDPQNPHKGGRGKPMSQLSPDLRVRRGAEIPTHARYTHHSNHMNFHMKTRPFPFLCPHFCRTFPLPLSPLGGEGRKHFLCSSLCVIGVILSSWVPRETLKGWTGLLWRGQVAWVFEYNQVAGTSLGAYGGPP